MFNVFVVIFNSFMQIKKDFKFILRKEIKDFFLGLVSPEPLIAASAFLDSLNPSPGCIYNI